jgi:hypothetical protein
MQVIWHDHKRVIIHIWEMDRDIVPTFLRNHPHRINPYLAAHYLPKQTLPPQCDDRNIKPSRLFAPLASCQRHSMWTARCRPRYNRILSGGWICGGEFGDQISCSIPPVGATYMSPLPSLNDLDLILCQPIQLIDQRINRPIC